MTPKIKYLALSVSLLVGLYLSACNMKAPESANGEDINSALFQKSNIRQFDLTDSKKIALTFDDGPTPKVTRALLEVLRSYNIKATFFLIGQSVAGQESTVRLMRDDGHIVANHSYSHANLGANLYKQDPVALYHQVSDSHYLIAPYMNPTNRMYFRAPYGAWTEGHAAQLNMNPVLSSYIGPIFWNVGGAILPAGARPRNASEIEAAADWDCWRSEQEKGITSLSVSLCAQGYFKDFMAKQGGVSLMHDTDLRTVELVKLLIPALLDEGFKFVTLDELSALDKYQYNLF